MFFTTSLKKDILLSNQGYSLIEILVAGLIVSLLFTLIALFGAQKARNMGKRTREIVAARSLIQAFHTYYAEHGVFFNGNNNQEEAYNLSGDKLAHTPPVATRYPWRLLPYLEGSLEGTLLVNESIEEVKDKDNPSVYSDYNVSLLPSLAMNITYVGSERFVRNRKGEVLGENPYTTNQMNEILNPSKLIVFISGGAYSSESPEVVNSDQPDKKIFHGYWHAYAPYDAISGSQWQRFDPETPIMGNVYLRWNRQAVAAHIDGNVKLLNEEELRDMRRWSNAAQEVNNPHWRGE